MKPFKLAQLRRQQLGEMIQRAGEVRLADAAQAFSVSEMTIRRDFDVLQVQGVAQRVRGGAVPPGPTVFAWRAERAATAKLVIASKLLDLIPDAGSVAFDASSTVAALAAKVPENDRVTYFTNGVETFNKLRQRANVRLYLLGGELDRRTENLVGPLTLRAVAGLYFDAAVFSCAALDPEVGVTEATLEDTEVKAAVLGAAALKILAVDRSKLGQRAIVRLCPLESFDILVTELDPEHRDLVDYRRRIEVR